MDKIGNWMIYRDDNGKVQVYCSECGHYLKLDEPIPDHCPECNSLNVDKESMN